MRGVLSQFLERASPSLSYNVKEACEYVKKYIYLSIYWSPSERSRMRTGTTRIFIMRITRSCVFVLSRPLFIRRSRVTWSPRKTAKFFFPLLSRSTRKFHLDRMSLRRSLPGSLRPLHSNAAYAISISASPVRAVGAADGIEKKVSSALKVSAPRPEPRTKC